MVENYYSLELDELYRIVQTDPKSGLSQAEVDNRLETHGPNEIPKPKSSFIRVYLAPLFNWLIVIYLIGSVIMFIASLLGLGGSLTMIAITLGIVFLNVMVAIIQQARATKKLNALKELSAPTSTVIRNGQKMDINTSKIVPGDLLVLSQGDKIPADARIVESFNLEVNEASLTGESEPVKKLRHGEPLPNEEMPISDRKNMVFYGTYITTGNGTSIIVKTGVDTEIGKISVGLSQASHTTTELQNKMNHFGKWLGIGVFAMWIVLFLIKLIITKDIVKANIAGSLNAAMDLMPINLPLMTTIILITGVLAMAQHGVIIRNLASVDSLGRVSIVCSDKTGTLTKNQMSVQYVWCNNSIYKVTGGGYDPDGEVLLIDDPKNIRSVRNMDEFPQFKLLLTAAYLNNNSALVKNEVEVGSKTIINWNVVGSPTEGALLVLFQKVMGSYNMDEYQNVREFPFDSSIKRMSKIYQRDGKFYSFTKGASEVLIPLCSQFIAKDTELEFTPSLKEDTQNYIDKFAGQGYRILSLTYKKLTESPPDTDESRVLCESDMIYIGFVAILDPPREGVKDSVEACHKAGVEVVMITGDSPATASAIASQISIITEKDQIAIEGRQIKDLIETPQFDKVRVFARVSPEHKQDIIKKYQSQKRIVAMTGDGVNDALALNMADAGIAMGITGTDVAKEAADMVISDDSFNSIVTGIHQGRGIFSKIRAVIVFFVCINVFEGLVQVFISVILDLNLQYWADPASPFYLQWLFLSLTLHALPSLILTFDSISDDVMDEQPKDSEEILSRNTLILMFSFGILLMVSMFIVYFITITGAYPVMDGNINFADNSAYLYTNETAALSLGATNATAKALTMLMVVLFFTECLLVWQIRRPNKPLIKSLREDSTKLMYLLLIPLWVALLSLMYIPGAQVALAGDVVFEEGAWTTSGPFFGFMYLTALDWLVCFAISCICIVGFEVVKWRCRVIGIVF